MSSFAGHAIISTHLEFEWRNLCLQSTARHTEGHPTKACVSAVYFVISTPPVAPEKIQSAYGISTRNGMELLAKEFLDVPVDGKLERCKSSCVNGIVSARLQVMPIHSYCTYHEQTSTDTRVASTEPKLFCNLNQPADRALTWKTFGLVDFAQHRVSRLRDNGCGETCHQAREKIDAGLHDPGRFGFIHLLIHGFRDLFVHNELGHGVRNSSLISDLDLHE